MNKHFFKGDIRKTTDTWKDAQHHSSSGKCKLKLQWGIPSHLPEWLKSTTQETTRVGKDVEKKEPSCTMGGKADWCSHCGKKWRFLKILKIELPVSQQSHCWVSKEYENTNSKGSVHPCVNCSIIYQIMRVAQVFMDGWIKKTYTYTHNWTLFSHKKEWNSAICNDTNGAGVWC